MTLARKQKLVVVMLAVLAVWPLLHHSLVRRYELNPWRFFGWSMYTRPVNKIAVRVRPSSGDYAALDGATVAGELAAYIRARASWGKLARPDALARATLERNPRLPGVVVEVENLLLRPESGRFELSPDIYRYERQGPE